MCSKANARSRSVAAVVVDDDHFVSGYVCVSALSMWNRA
jgi:hypothetical protein